MTRNIAIAFFLATAGCAVQRHAGSAHPPEPALTRTALSEQVSVVVLEDPWKNMVSYTLEGILIENDGVSLEFIPTVVWAGSSPGPVSGVMFRGTVHSPEWREVPRAQGTVLPVMGGTDFIRLVGDRASVTFFIENALEFRDDPTMEGLYSFEAAFSLEPPTLETMVCAEQVSIAGENPVWRLRMDDTQREYCRRFIRMALHSHDGTIVPPAALP